MFWLMGLNVIAVATTQIARPAAVPTSGIDALMLFGFVAAFSTIIALIYRNRLKTRFPLLVICLMALSAYGFIEGTWALGFSLAALAASELNRWSDKRKCRDLKPAERRHQNVDYEPESRMARMFGSL